MATYKVVWEIELDAETPLEAAKTALDWIKDGNDSCNNCNQFTVQEDDYNTKKELPIYSVDLQEEDEDAVLQITQYKPLISEL